MKNVSTAIMPGTIPEIINMSPAIHEFEQTGLNYFILHTSQHYSHEMHSVLFRQPGLHDARYNLNTGSAPHKDQTGMILMEIENVLIAKRPGTVTVVLVMGWGG